MGTVRITIVDATHAAAAELTRVGVLRLTVKAAYALKSADLSSPVSTSTGVLAGTWLAHSAPVIVSCNASDGGSQEGIGNGDVITVVFDQEINSPAIASKDDVDAVFAFTDPSGAVVSLGANYTGEYAWEPLDATVAVTNGDVEVGCAVDLSTSIFVGDEIKIGGVVYKVAAAPTAAPTNTFAPTPSPTPTPTATPTPSPTSVPTAAPTKLVSNPALSCDPAGTCTCAACCNAYFASNLDQCATCVLQQCTDAPTTAPSAMPTLAPSPVPSMSPTEATTPSPTALPTTAPTAAPTSSNRLTLGAAYVGVTSSAVPAYRRSRSTMLITIVDVCDQMMVGFGLDDATVSGSTKCNDTAPYKNTRVNSAQWGNGMSLTVKASADLTSEDRSSVLSTATSTLSGSWGDHAAPAIVSTTASDGGSSSGLNTGDKITVVFDRHTNVPAVSTKTGVDTLLSFSATLGTNYTGVWLSLSVLELELTTVYNRFNDDMVSPFITP